MEQTTHSTIKDPASLVRKQPFSLERLLSHIDAGPVEESEAFVQTIYEQRRAQFQILASRKGC